MELSRNNTYTGATTVNAGTLLASAAGSLGATSGITLNSRGTLLLGGPGNRLGDGASLTLGGGSLKNQQNSLKKDLSHRATIPGWFCVQVRLEKYRLSKWVGWGLVGR